MSSAISLWFYVPYWLLTLKNSLYVYWPFWFLSFVKCIFKSFAHFFLLILGIIYIFGVIYPWHPKYTRVHWSYSVSCLFAFSVIFGWIFISFWVLPFHFQCYILMDTILNFTEVQYVPFFFYLYGQCFLCLVEKSASSVYEDFLSSRSITVLPFIFKSEIV